ncbi:MAG: hypothetical protein ACFE89_01340 [Candidatus Hodarchaeota archaeon]
MKLSLRICSLLITILFIASVLGIQNASPVAAQPIPIQITDVEVPSEVAQAARGQVKATITNPQNLTHDGFALFSDDLGEIISHSPQDPYIPMLNFTIGPEAQLNISLDYSVAANATIGIHVVTFEINVGGFSFLFEQYEIAVVPVATITSVSPGHVFTQGTTGSLIVTITNHVDTPRIVRLDTFGSKFVNTSEEVELAPGQNNIVLLLSHNVTHVYDFGMSAVNVSMYYLDELIDSEVILVPVDMTVLNKLVAIIIPVSIFLLLVFIYAFRKRRRLRVATVSE